MISSHLLNLQNYWPVTKVLSIFGYFSFLFLKLTLWYSHYGNTVEVPDKHCGSSWTAMWSSNATPGYLSKENENTNSKRYMQSNIHCSITIAKTWKQLNESTDEWIKKTCVCCVCVCVCVCIYIYIYIERERERERECQSVEYYSAIWQHEWTWRVLN